MKNNIITFAAYDSSKEAKECADYVCPGHNDGEFISQIIHSIHRPTIRVFFKDGQYIFDKVHYSEKENKYYGILLDHTLRSITLEGETFNSYPNPEDKRPSNEKLKEIGTCFVLREEATKDLPNNVEISILSMEKFETSRPFLCVKNIAFFVPNNDKQYIGLDGLWAGSINFENIWVRIDRPSLPWFTEGYDCWYNVNYGQPLTYSVGIRAPLGSQNGHYLLQQCECNGFNRGFELGGEHIIALNCNAVMCYYSFYLGTTGGIYHSNCFINCNEEFCIGSIFIDEGIDVGTLYDFVSYDIEFTDDGPFANKFRAIDKSGKARGNVSYTSTRSCVGSDNLPFWEKGSGEHFRTFNANDKLSGTKEERPKTPHPNQQYYDTSINKMLFYINGSWRDAMGNLVS